MCVCLNKHCLWIINITLIQQELFLACLSSSLCFRVDFSLPLPLDGVFGLLLEQTGRWEEGAQVNVSCHLFLLIDSAHLSMPCYVCVLVCMQLCGSKATKNIKMCAAH